MTSGEHIVILFHSTSYAIRAERVLKKAGVPSKMVPVPRHLSSNCGVCIRVALPDREAAIEALEEVGVEMDGVHDV